MIVSNGRNGVGQCCASQNQKRFLLGRLQLILEQGEVGIKISPTLGTLGGFQVIGTWETWPFRHDFLPSGLLLRVSRDASGDMSVPARPRSPLRTFAGNCRGLFIGPDRFRPALQEHHAVVLLPLAVDGPLDVLRNPNRFFDRFDRAGDGAAAERSVKLGWFTSASSTLRITRPARAWSATSSCSLGSDDAFDRFEQNLVDSGSSPA